MATREIGFGLYDVRRPATSPTRKGAAKGRPQPRVESATPPLPSPALTPSPPRALGSPSPPLNNHTSPSTASHFQGLAAAQRSTAVGSSEGRGRPAVAGRAAPRVPADCNGGGGSPALPRHPVRPGPSPPHLSPLAREPTSVSSSPSPSSSSSYVEQYISCVVRFSGTPVLLPSLLETLHGALRHLQLERAQRKGQEPRRRPSSVAATDLDSEVTLCLTRAAQATSLVAAGDVLCQFLVAHGATTGPPACTATPMAQVASCSPVVLVGATLADLVVSGRIPYCSLSPSCLLRYLDAAVAAGHSGAMVSVGVCLRDGRLGVACDVAAGIAWMRCAAAAGYLPAMHELGEMYELGVPSPSQLTADVREESEVDWGEAMRWYREAAEAGYTASQLNLAKLLLLAAEQGTQDASADTAALGHLTTEATRWLQACAAAGVEEAVRLQQRMK